MSTCRALAVALVISGRPRGAFHSFVRPLARMRDAAGADPRTLEGGRGGAGKGRGKGEEVGGGGEGVGGARRVLRQTAVAHPRAEALQRED